MNKKDHYQHIYDLCKKHMHAYVLVEMVDGAKVDGIITGLDNEYVYFAVPIEHDNYSAYQESMMKPFDMRQYWGGYPGYGPGYGYGYYPPRRFERLVLPLAALATLSLLPWY